jgi:hypothetical protein
MANGFNAESLRSLVPVMRELGVLQAFGVILGPPPPRVVALAAKAEANPEDAAVSQELAEELRRGRLQAARDEIRLQVSASGDMSDEDCDRLLGPERIAELAL